MLDQAVRGQLEALEQERDKALAAANEAEHRHNAAAATTAAELERLSRRESELTAMLAEASESSSSLASRLTNAETAFDSAIQQKVQEQLASAERAARRETELQAQLADVVSTRDRLERELRATAARLQEAESRATRERTAAAARAAEREAALDARIRQECAARAIVDQQLTLAQSALEHAEQRQSDASVEAASRLAALQTRLDAEAAQHTELRETLTRKLGETHLALDDVRQRHAAATEDIETLKAREAELMAELAETDAARASLEVQVGEFAKALEDAEARADGERTAAANRQTDLESQLAEQVRSREAVERALDETRIAAADYSDRLAETEERLERARQTAEEDVRKFAAETIVAQHELEQARRTFQETLDRASSEHTDALARLAAIISDREADIQSRNAEIADQAASLRTAASERTDLQTQLEALQERLTQAQRMEAVGRLASEVAVTCINLLTDIHEEAEEWLETAGTDPVMRQQGEMMLGEIARAAGFLRQLSVYGEEEASALMPVDLSKVLRDIAPVLKRVAGDHVELDMPQETMPIILDVERRRVERLLVNLAGYGRQRMPRGGRLRVEAATVILDDDFIAKYPNVRAGQHALVTVTEERRTAPAEGALQFGDWGETASDRAPSQKVGVDLGALQALIRECGGHLWMTASSSGDMVVQIHLPLRRPDDLTVPRPARRITQRLATPSLVRH